MATTLEPRSTRPQLNPVTSLARILTFGAGISAVLMAVYQVASPGSPGANYASIGDFVREGLTLGYLLLSCAAVGTAWRAGIIGRVGALLVIIGYGLITIGVAIGLILRSDPDWFFLLGGPGNLAAGIGFVVMAVTIWRARALPRWSAVLCGVGGFFAILLAELGTTVLIGAFWLFLATRLTTSGGPARTVDSPR
jgi:hypothetical protein